MRVESEIQDRIRHLLNEELDKRVREAGARQPHCCVHNHRQPLDERKQLEGYANELYNRITDERHLPVLRTIGLCMLGAENPEQWNGTICDEPADAQRCPYFTPKMTKEVVWEGFHEQIRDLDWVRGNLPEVYGLLWALGSERAPALPWWKRAWFKFLRIRVDPIVSSSDTTPSLLPPGEA